MFQKNLACIDAAKIYLQTVRRQVASFIFYYQEEKCRYTSKSFRWAIQSSMVPLEYIPLSRSQTDWRLLTRFTLNFGMSSKVG